MENELIETGKIINTHGLRGEVKIDPWADSPAAFTAFERLFIEGKEYKMEKARVNKRFVIAKLSGVDTIDMAESLRERIVYVPREDLDLGEDEYLLSDLIGLTAVDNETEEVLGKITDILTPPGGEVLEIRGEREILVPLNPEFVADVDIEDGKVYIDLIEGM